MNTKFEKILSGIDKTWLGFILALLAPIITLAIVFVYKFDNYTLDEFIDFLKSMHIMSKLFSLCVIPNLGLFFLFIWGNLLRGSRGVLAATFVVTFAIIVVQYIL